MASITKYAKTVSQTTGGKYRDFANLSNIKNNTDNSWATSNGLIRSKTGSPNRPSKLSLTNFGFSLPTGAEVTKVVVEYRHKKIKATGASNVCNIPAPTITLLGVAGFSGKGSAPSLSMTTHTKTFTGTKLTRANINANRFGVELDYPTNSNKYEGQVAVSYIRIRVEYKTSSYGLKLKKVRGGHNGEDYVLEVSISNKNLTSYNPTVTLTTPIGFNFLSKTGDGNLTTVNNRTFIWDPKMTKKVGTRTAQLRFSTNVTFSSGASSYTGTFTAVESLNSATTTHSAVITVASATSDEVETGNAEQEITISEEVTSNYLHVGLNEAFTADFTINEAYDSGNQYSLIASEGGLQWSDDGGETWNSTVYHPVVSEDDSTSFNLLCRFTTIGWKTLELQKLIISTEETESVGDYLVDVRPDEEDIPTPFLVKLELAEEELNRLGQGYTYAVHTELKVVTNEIGVHDWYKNFRIGVFNNPIHDNITVTESTDSETGEVTETITDSTDYDNLTNDEIFENAEYWGNCPANPNEFEDVECQFTYNEDYPLYILVTGEYPEIGDVTNNMIKFKDLCIIESDVYKEREPTGIYPVSIVDLINGEGNSAELALNAFEQSTPVVLYDLPLSEAYGTNENIAIRGIMLSGTIEQSDELIVYAKLKAPTGVIGQRSIVLNNKDVSLDSENSFTIGGLGDLWGFNTLEMVNLEDWEIELTASNILNEIEGSLNIGDITLTLFVENVEEQSITTRVEGENIAYYGASLSSIEIPEGLETSTSFLTIDGTDTNDAYRQNIKEKVIELGINIVSCDIETSTSMLRQLTQLLVNEKDKYNRPIPKRIEFSHYPDVYFEYIMTDALDVSESFGSYSIKAKLTVPAGTSYSKNSTVTSTMGFVQGLAAVNPLITVSPSGSTIEVSESVTGQKFNMGYGGDWNNKVILINCEDREVLLMENEDDSNPIDISRYVDMNSDWFSLHGEFYFNTVNCTVRTVEYNERW